ncbi:serine hydrolase [Sphingomonas alpina]|uniref:Serine hydrolase n=1 Tax=Sphingomonas alpina TaxID=653931 RepID=A0A7H0LED7_9SPHN|nr:serine hydrolase [Sphingomonas alpina]QNQ08040.1 serine hydrolase [Sphingomonas alpina]
MRLLLALFATLLVPIVATAQTPPAASVKAAPELEARIAELPTLLMGGGDYNASFSAAFRTAVPKETFATIGTQLSTSDGKVTGIERITPASAWSAVVLVGYERGIATMQIVADPAPPHQITGLLITGMSAREATLGAVIDTLAKLPGVTGFAFARLDAAGPVMLQSRAPDRGLAIGSEFKLVILAELVRSISAGERRWEDEITLAGTGLPGGAYMSSPAGTKVSLYDLAEKMISVSDNSATDILLKLAGRAKVEAMLGTVGIADPAGMRPFLSTLELFKLKGASGGALGERWAGLDEAGRRALLDGDVARLPVSAINPALFASGKPIRVGSIEWFASPADMVRVMDWLRRHTESGPAARAREILAKNSGVGAGPAGRWQYLGFKGGSEPGVIAMTFLLQGKDGHWYAMSGSWNDVAAPVDEGRFAGLMARAVELAAGS